MLLFDAEKKTIATARQAANSQMWPLLGLAAIATLAPIAVNMPRAMKGFSLATAFASSVALSCVATKSSSNQKEWEYIETQQQLQFRNALERESERQALVDLMCRDAELLEVLEAMPAHQAVAYAEEWGIALGMGEESFLLKLGIDPETYEYIGGDDIQTVDTTAQPVPKEGAISHISAPTPSPVARATSSFRKGRSNSKDPFPTEDLASLMAQMSVDANICGSILIACPKGTGKSNLLNAAIAATNNLNQGNVDFCVFNGKQLAKGKNFCGLEKSAEDYIYVDVDTIGETLSRMKAINSDRLSDYPGFPTVIISDEWNNSLLAAKMYDTANKTKHREEMNMLVYQQVTKGRDKLLLNIVTSHSPYVEDIGQNRAIQGSMDMIVLSRGNRTDAMIKALSGARSIVDNVQARDRLATQFNDYLNGNTFDPNRVIALTNLASGWRLVFLPQYPDSQPEIDRGTLNQSNEEIVYGMDEPEAPEPTIPEPTFTAIPKPSLTTPDVDLKQGDLYAGIADAEKKAGRQLTTSELKKFWQKYTKQPLTDEAANLLRALIDKKKSNGV